MAKAAVGTNLPASCGAEQTKTLPFPLATMDDLACYSFLNTEALAVIKENLGGQMLSQGDLERIKFPSSGTTFWQIPSLSGKMMPVEEITGIILMQRHGRAYWQKEYTGEQVPPDCSSQDGIIGVGTPGGTCATCPFNVWGSSPKEGSDAKACKELSILFVLRPDEVLPTIITVPPTSLQNIKKFMLKLASKDLKYNHCVLSLGLEEAKNKKGVDYSKIAPRMVAILPPEAQAQIDAYVLQLRDAFARIQVNQDEVA